MYSLVVRPLPANEWQALESARVEVDLHRGLGRGRTGQMGTEEINKLILFDELQIRGLHLVYLAKQEANTRSNPLHIARDLAPPRGQDEVPRLDEP
jgi:hypothetical protein